MIIDGITLPNGTELDPTELASLDGGIGGAGLHAETGYQVLPSGLILQWGTSSSSGSTAIALPFTFPNAGLNGVVTHASLGGAYNANVAVNGVSTTHITVYSASGITVRWLAIGY